MTMIGAFSMPVNGHAGVSRTRAALTGILLAARIGSGQPTAADSCLLDAYAAVFLGSAALKDGEFHILGTLIGVMTVGVGFNGLAMFGAPTFYQYLFKGGLLIVAMALGTVAANTPDVNRPRVALKSAFSRSSPIAHGGWAKRRGRASRRLKG